jgi:cytochrome c-type biogenesis protein CcmH/NrfG
MANLNAPRNTTASNWTSKQAYILAVICLLLGGASGYLLRGSSSSDQTTTAAATSAPAMPSTAAQQPTPEQMAQMARKQAEPLLAQLKTRPSDVGLLSQIGNVFYDAAQYDDAIGYYKQALKIDPKNVDVRSDMATCYWYKNDPNTAITEFEKSLTYNPSHASTLYNLGVVRWQGKGDPKGAVEAWQKLLDTNPNYENKARVVELISRARQHASGGVGNPKG